MSQLESTFPKLADKITSARDNGYSDKQIESFLQERIETARYNGYSDDQIASYVGFQQKSDKPERLKAIGHAYSLPPSAVEDTMIVAKGTGMNPHLLLDNRALYQEVSGRGEKKKVDVPKTLSDFGRRNVMDTQETPEGVDPMEWKHMVGYSAALPFSRVIERPAWAITGLGFSLLDEAAEIAGFDHSKAGKWFSEMADFYNNPDANAPISNYAAGIRSARRESYYDRGFAWGIANDISDASLDLGYLIMTMKGLAGAKTVGEQSQLLPKMMSQMDRIKGTAKLHGLHAFLTTPGDMQDRFEAGLYRIAYNLTPYVAQAPALGNLTGKSAILTDIMLNTMLSSGQYKQMFDDAGGINKDFVAQALPNLVMDTVMSLSTTGSREALTTEARAQASDNKDRLASLIAKHTGRAEASVRESLDDIDKAREESEKRDWTPRKDDVSRETIVDNENVSRETITEKLDADTLSKTVEDVALSKEDATESLADATERLAEDTTKAPREDLQGMSTSNLKSYERTITKQVKETEKALFALREEGTGKEDLTAEYEELGSLFGEMLAIRDEMSGRTDGKKNARAKKPAKMPEATWELYTNEFMKDPQKGTAKEQLIKESDALKASFKKAAQASRKAFSAGKGEGVSKERARQKALRDKQRQKKQARKILKKMVNDVVRAPNSNTVHADEVREIETILEDYSLKALREDKADIKQEMDETAQSLVSPKEEARIDVDIETFLSDIHPRDRAMLGKKTLNDMTVLEFAELHERVMDLKEQGRQRLEQKKAREAQELDDTMMMLMEILGPKNKMTGLVPMGTKDTEKSVGMTETWLKANSFRPARLADMMDGNKDYKGKFYRTIIESTDRLYNRFMRATSMSFENMDEKMEKLGLRMEDLAKPFFASPRFGQPLQLDQVMLIWGYWQNAKGQASLKAQGITTEMATKMFSKLEDRHKELVREAFKDAKENFEKYDKAYVDLYNVHPPKEDNYLRMYRVGDKGGNIFEQFARMAKGQGIGKAYAEKGAGIARSTAYDALPPLKLDIGFYETWHRSVVERETLVHLGRQVHDLHALFGKDEKDARIPALGETIKQTYGSPYLKAIQSYINRVADPNFYKTFDDIGTVASLIRENSAIAYLGYNLLTMAKQVPSMMLYLTEVGPVPFLRTCMDATTGFDTMMEFAFKLDPEMKHRSLDRSIETLRNSRDPIDRRAYKRMLFKLKKNGMLGIAMLDRVVTVIGWNAVFRQALKNGEDVESAALRAKRITLNTQPAASAKEIASLYSQNEFLNVALLFTNQLNNIYNLGVHDVWGNMKNKNVKKAVTTMLAISMNAWAMQALITGEPIPEDPKKWFTGVAANGIGAVPLVGKYIGGALQGYRSGSEILDKVFGDGTRVLKDVASMEADWDTAMRAFQVFALTQGSPYTGFKRVLDMDGPLDVKTLFGIRSTKNKKRRRF